MHIANEEIIITPVRNKGERKTFVRIGQKFAAATPHSVPQLFSELYELVNPEKNPFFDHARVELFIAFRGGIPVGRISAHIDELALELPAEQGFGPGTGMFGYFDAADKEVGHMLLRTAEAWLREQKMTTMLGPISMSVWEEPGLLTLGHDHSPMLMMGHHPAHYQGWIEAGGYQEAKKLFTYEVDVSQEFPPIVQRVVKSGERNKRLVMRNADIKHFDREVGIILNILNDAWSDNWGFVPFTEREIAYAGKKLKQIVLPDIIKIMELDGEPEAFMITLPDINTALAEINGKLLPFGWVKLLRWLRNPKNTNMRVPLMGVLKKHHNTRLASQMAFMMIDDIRRIAFEKFNVTRGEIGWILDDNKGMVAIADAIGSTINREYTIYKKEL